VIASIATLGAAVLVDLVFGEPPNAAHPVAWTGKLIAWGTRIAPKRGAGKQIVAGSLLALTVPSTVVALCMSVFWGLRGHPVALFLTEALLLKATFALRALPAAANVVRSALVRGDLPEGRRALASLCSRDASTLQGPALIAATVESVAENASDSFVAPLFYFVLFGVPGAVFYRAVNTLDAMIGYRGRYEWLGKASARLDDLLNLVPARMTAALLLVAGLLSRKDAAHGWLVLRREGALTESPNAGRPMAAMTGLLRIELAKDGHYRLGDALDGLEVSKITEACVVTAAAAVLALALAFMALGAKHALFH
jgi:adenosylcobinamide-phosphate synthase